MGPSTPVLRVTSVSPSQGSTTGGTNITVNGTNFASDATVTVGGVVATNVVLDGATTIRAVVGSRSTAGASDVAVTSGGRTATLATAFTFVAPSGTNQPPVVTSVRSIGPQSGEPSGFAEQGETVTLVATVTDAETSTSSLAYQWAGPGTFTGSNAIVVWRLPATVSPTPSAATATLTVTETFVEGSVTHKNVTTFPFVIQVHDSPKEVGDMARDFLQLFSQSSVPPDTVVHNFQDGCGAGGTGKRDERDQTTNNRSNYNIVFWTVDVPRVTINFGGVSPYRFRRADAWAAVDVMWVSACLRKDLSIGCAAAGSTRTDRGVDWVTAHYDVPTNRWWLCDSDYESKTSTTTTRYLK